MCDILAGLLSGGGASGPGNGQFSNNMLSIYLDPAHFGARNFVAKAMDYTAYVKSSPPAAGTAEVLVPGEPEARNQADRLTHGVPLQVDTWSNLCVVASRFGIAIPA